MVKTLSIGILGIQGAISEHVTSMNNVFKKRSNINGMVFVVRNKREIDDLDALIMPGGESSTIYRVLNKSGMYDAIEKRIKENNLPIMGTCAGCVLLSNEIVNNKKEIKPFNAMDMQVERNAFGRQKESFEQNINIKGFNTPYKAVFIRAPVIKKIWGKCETLAKINEKIVMARQDRFLALAFHPELAQDTRVHQYFIKMIV